MKKIITVFSMIIDKILFKLIIISNKRFIIILIFDYIYNINTYKYIRRFSRHMINRIIDVFVIIQFHFL